MAIDSFKRLGSYCDTRKHTTQPNSIGYVFLGILTLWGSWTQYRWNKIIESRKARHKGDRLKQKVEKGSTKHKNGIKLCNGRL